MKYLTMLEEHLRERLKIKKIVGVILIIVGLFAFFTPFTPGSWLAVIGFELLGLRILFFDKFKFWRKK
ncbi:MAG: hypothetical protein AAB677_00695 [Patescibacteria group bacterium]